MSPSFSLNKVNASRAVATVPVTLQCNVDNQWLVKKEAQLYSAVTQSESSSFTDQKAAHAPAAQSSASALFSVSVCLLYVL